MFVLLQGGQVLGLRSIFTKKKRERERGGCSLLPASMPQEPRQVGLGQVRVALRPVSSCRPLWRSLACSSVTRTTSLTSTSTSTSASLTRRAAGSTVQAHVDLRAAQQSYRPAGFGCSENWLTGVPYTHIYFFLSYNKMLSPLNAHVLSGNRHHFTVLSTARRAGACLS